jgi:hypothetical protein
VCERERERERERLAVWIEECPLMTDHEETNTERRRERRNGERERERERKGVSYACNRQRDPFSISPFLSLTLLVARKTVTSEMTMRTTISANRRARGSTRSTDE